MNTTCPNCSQDIEIDGPTLASLQGTAHFECPTYQGAVPVPPMPGRTPTPPRPSPVRASSSAMAQTHKGMNRNLLVLGVIVLLVLGGIAAFLASRNGGNIFNTVNNVTNQIIHNNYFTQLLASGVTTEKDLQAIAEIRPYGDGFIGISKESLTWEQAQNLAKRTGSEILSVASNTNGSGSGSDLLKWLSENYGTHISLTVWVMHQGEVCVFDGLEFFVSTVKNRQRNTLLQWVPSGSRRAPAIESPYPVMTKLSPLPGQVPASWKQSDVVARIKGEGAILFPRVSIPTYVLEVDLVMHSSEGKVSLVCGGRPGTEVVLGTLWPQDQSQTKVPCRLFRVHGNGGVSWNGERHFEPDQRMTLTLFISKEFWVLKRNGASILTSRPKPEPGDPVDLAFKIQSGEKADATIYNVAWRQLVDSDIADMGR